MRFAVSNIALPAYEHGAELDALAAFGLEGVEVAPSRVWQNTWHGLRASDVAAYRARVEAAGLAVVGLHSLFFDQPDLGLFRDGAIRARTLDFLTHLSSVCRDLGGRTLVYGSAPARRRGDLSLDVARDEAVMFFSDLADRIDDHGTCFCFEPLGPDEADFVNSVYDALDIVEAVNSPVLRTQIDAKALVANEELSADVFEAAAPTLVHVHTNEPGLGVLGRDGAVDHAAMGSHLKAIGYEGFVSIEQRMLNEDDPLADVSASAEILRRCYG